MEQRSVGARWAREKRTSHLTIGLIEVFQDIFRLFDKSDNVTLDGKDLFGILNEQGIHVTHNLVDEVLTILNHHNESMDVYEFVSLVNNAIEYIRNAMGGKEPVKMIIACLREFLLKSAIKCLSGRESFIRRSADTLGFYFAGARLSGLTEKQVTERALSIDTTGHSPYKQPLVLPGLPIHNNAKGGSKINSFLKCTILPPPPNSVGGRKLSKCTVLPYTAGPELEPAEDESAKVVHYRASISRGSVCIEPAMKSKPAAPDPIRVEVNARKSKPKPRGRPLPFSLPPFPDYGGKKITFEEINMIRDQILMAQRAHQRKQRALAAKKIVAQFQSEIFQKRFRNTIKAYFG